MINGMPIRGLGEGSRNVPIRAVRSTAAVSRRSPDTARPEGPGASQLPMVIINVTPST